MGANPVPLIVPCHRCLGNDGSMTGFSTEGGIDLKARMLFREGYVANKEHAKGIEHLRSIDPVMRKIIKVVGPYRALPDKPRPAWDTILTAIVHQQLSKLIDASNFFVCLYDEDTEQYYFPYFVDEEESVDPEQRFTLRNTMTDFVRRNHSLLHT